MDRVAAFVLYSDSDFGGAERRLIRIYNQIAKQKRVHLIVRGSDEALFLKRLEKADCCVDNIERIIFFHDNLRCLMSLLLNYSYETFHFFDLCGFNKKLAYISSLLRKKTILTVAYQNYAYGIIDDSEKKRLSKLLDACSVIDVLFPAGEEYFKSISNNKNITVTPGTFTDLQLFRPGNKERIILFAAARLEKDKNAMLLVEAINLIKNEIRLNQYRIIICGQGFEENTLKARIKEYKIEDVVEMPGYVKVSEIFPKAELFTCLDLIDNYPSQTIAEAAACGCGLLLTDVGYSRRCGNDSFCYFVDNNANELAKSILEYISSSESEKNDLAKKARKFAEERYSIESSVTYFTKLIEEDFK